MKGWNSSHFQVLLLFLTEGKTSSYLQLAVMVATAEGVKGHLERVPHWVKVVHNSLGDKSKYI